MSSEKLTPPGWLNPDAILGAVSMGDAYVTVHWVIGIDGHWLKVATERPYNEDISMIQRRHVTLCPDLWPVKPELAALFGEGAE